MFGLFKIEKDDGIRVPFNVLFKQNEDGSITTKNRFRISGVSYPPGILMVKGCSLAGIDWSLFKGRDLQIRTDNGEAVIIGLY